jgi:hypothetical protein
VWERFEKDSVPVFEFVLICRLKILQSLSGGNLALAAAMFGGFGLTVGFILGFFAANVVGLDDSARRLGDFVRLDAGCRRRNANSKITPRKLIIKIALLLSAHFFVNLESDNFIIS